jgi:hypothetical protein
LLPRLRALLVPWLRLFVRRRAEPLRLAPELLRLELLRLELLRLAAFARVLRPPERLAP